MNLTTTSKITELLPKITANYHPFILAIESKSVRECTKLEAVTFIIGAFNKATMLKGQVADARADRFIGEGLYDEFMKKAPHARLGEIELAFKNGALGEYTKRDDRGRAEFEGINVSTLWGFWKSYASSNEVLEAKKELARAMDLQMYDKPVVKIDLTESIKKAFEDYCLTGELPFTASHYYIILCKLHDVKTLIKDNSVRATIRERAMIEYRSNLIKDKINIKDKPKFDVLLKYCMEGKNPTYDSISRKLALKHYFEECKNKGVSPI